MFKRNIFKDYLHRARLGTTDYLTSPVSGKVTSWTHYNEWGEITHNAVLKCGQRELDLVKRFATHDFDAVLNMYYAKARFYDAENRRFAAVDPVKGNITDPMSMVQYLYVVDAPLTWVDPLGLFFIYEYNNNGVKSYQLTDQSKFDAWVSPFLPESIQATGHQLFFGGKLVGGTSQSTMSMEDEFKAIFSVEYEYMMANIGTVPYIGPVVVAGIKLRELGMSISSIAENLEISDRDDIIIRILDNENINRERNTSANFIAAAYALDDFVKNYNYLFSSQNILGGYSQYEVGYALANNDDKIIQKAEKALINYFYFPYHDQIRAQYSTYDVSHYSTLRSLSGKDAPAVLIYRAYYDDKGRLIPYKTFR